jgi:hypothetical protein
MNPSTSTHSSVEVDESVYLDALKRRGSPLLKEIAATTNP